MSLSTLLIDDERRAVALLKKLIEETHEFDRIGCAFSASAAMEQVKRSVPDLIFLDIKMPGKDGLSLLEDLERMRIRTEVVFVTAFDQYALQAIKHHAFDYLMKPVIREDLMTCVQAFKIRRKPPDFSERLSRFLSDYEANKKIRFNSRAGFFQVQSSSIVYCRADGNYTHVNTGEADQLCTVSLGQVETRLPSTEFIRLGRSYILSSRYIYKVDRKSCEVVFEKDRKFYSLTLSRRQIKELDKLI